MTASEGENKFTIRLTKTGHETFAFPLILNIIGVPFGGEESHSESSILQQFIDEAESYADDAHDSAVDANASKNAAKAYYDNLASFGTKNHSIMDSNGSPMPARDVLQFANSRVKDDATNNKTIVAPAHGHTNLLNPTLQTTTVNGVTCTNNGDGTYTLNGTASVDNTRFYLENRIPIGERLKKGKTYKLLDGLNNTSVFTYDLQVALYSGTKYAGYAYATVNGEVIFTLPDAEYDNYYTYISIREGQTFDNVTFKPMLTTDLSATYDDFVQYSGDGELNENVANLYKGLENTDVNLADVQSQIVTSGNIENGNTATSAHTVGTYIQWKGKFYVVTSAIAVGDTLAVGTNLAAKTVGEVLTQINADLSAKQNKAWISRGSASGNTGVAFGGEFTDIFIKVTYSSDYIFSMLIPKIATASTYYFYREGDSSNTCRVGVKRDGAYVSDLYLDDTTVNYNTRCTIEVFTR
jgi:hypothetical protein